MPCRKKSIINRELFLGGLFANDYENRAVRP